MAVFLFAPVRNSISFREAKGIRNIAKRLARRDLVGGAKFPREQAP